MAVLFATFAAQVTLGVMRRQAVVGTRRAHHVPLVVPTMLPCVFAERRLVQTLVASYARKGCLRALFAHELLHRGGASPRICQTDIVEC